MPDRIDPIEILYAHTRIFLHEPGCTCGLDHDGKLDLQEGKVAILTTLDERAKMRYFQVWYRTGKWSLKDAIEQLLDRKRKQSGGRAA
jgi:hypothetical protein